MDDKSKKLKELFENMEDLSADKLQNLVGESIKTFEEIISKLNSPNEEERQKALKDAADLRDTLEHQAKKALEKSGLDKEAIDKFIENPNNFSADEWRALKNAQKEIDTYQEELSEKGVINKKSAPSHKAKKHKKVRNPKKWLHG